MNTNKLLEWFFKNYPLLIKSMMVSSHNLIQTNPNPYHLEDNVWTHTMLVLKISELYNYPIEVKISCLLHDIGKPATRTEVKKNGIVHFNGHEFKSHDLAVSILFNMYNDGIIELESINSILCMIKNHDMFYRTYTKGAILQEVRRRKIPSREILVFLAYLCHCDNEGRFSSVDRKVPFSETFNDILLLSKELEFTNE